KPLQSNLLSGGDSPVGTCLQTAARRRPHRHVPKIWHHLDAVHRLPHLHQRCSSDVHQKLRGQDALLRKGGGRRPGRLTPTGQRHQDPDAARPGPSLQAGQVHLRRPEPVRLCVSFYNHYTLFPLYRFKTGRSTRSSSSSCVARSTLRTTSTIFSLGTLIGMNPMSSL
ncbi:unnamed protein product, partial [Ixodes hexagonus]